MSENDKTWLIARTSMRRRRVVREPDPRLPGDRGATVAEDLRMGQPFEVPEAEAKSLVTAGAARRPTPEELARLKGGAPAATSAEPEDDGLERKTVAELKEVVEQRGITLPAGTNTKAEIIAAIRKA